MAISPWTCFEQLTTDAMVPLNGGSVTVYLAGTTTPVSLFTADDLTGAAANPIVLDSAGRSAMRYMAAAKYKTLIKDSSGNPIKTHDNIDPAVPLGTGVLAIANGGTGATTGAGAIVNLGGATSAEVAAIAATQAAFASTPLITSTDTGTAQGPTLDLYRNKAVPATNDIIGALEFNGNDSGGAKQGYGKIYCQITDKTATSEDGQIYVDVTVNGVNTNRAIFGATVVYFPNALQVVNDVACGTLTSTGSVSGGTATGSMIATQAEQETGSATDKIVTPGRQQYHPSAAKFWAVVTVSGGVPSLGNSYNVTSITDTATGRLTVTIATDFSSSGWAGFVDVTLNNITVRIAGLSVGTPAAGSCEYGCITAAPAYTDPDSWYVGGYGDQ